MLEFVGRSAPDPDLTAFSPAEFAGAFARWKLKPGSPETLYALGKTSLAGFLAGLSAPGFEEALELASAGGSSRPHRRQE